MRDKILIVEDERITAEDLREVLEGLGYEVTAVVPSGAEAIASAEKQIPDLVLMDIRIRGALDGTQTAMMLRERFDLPVIYLTATCGLGETLENAPRKPARPVGYVVKPFQESELQASIEIALYKQRFGPPGENRQEQLTDVLSSLILGIISVDREESVVVVNAAVSGLPERP